MDRNQGAEAVGMFQVGRTAPVRYGSQNVCGTESAILHESEKKRRLKVIYQMTMRMVRGTAVEISIKDAGWCDV